jgi:uncharacterized protein with FMN-binding domain
MTERDNEADNKNQKMIASFVVILAVVVLAVGITYFTHKKTSATSMAIAPAGNSSATAGGSTTSGATASTSSASYKDGTYTASGSYQTPGGQESIGLTVAVKNGVVTETSLQQNGNNNDTREYQADFASGYQSKVVGKALDSISLSRVSGSSLTSQGFNDALDQIKSQAKS